MRVTERGQITIPLALRKKFGITSAVEVEVVEAEGELRIVVLDDGRSPGQRMVDRMRGKANFGMSTDEYMRLIRGDDDE